MPSDTPKDGRCGAKVVSKVGLEVHDTVLGKVFSDDPTYPATEDTRDRAEPTEMVEDELHAVVLYDGEIEQEVDPTWDDALPLLRKEWYVEAVIVERETDDSITHERVEIEDSDPYVTNRTIELDGYCLRYPMDNGTCYVHQGGAEKDNSYHMKHGMYADRSKFLNWLEEEGRDEDRQWVEIMVDSWIDDAPFTLDNTAKVNELYRAAIDQLRLFYAQDEFVVKGDGEHNRSDEYSGLAYKQVIGQNDEGEEIEIFEESALNLPYSRLDRDVQQKLTKLGIYKSEEEKQGEATGKSIAQALSQAGDE